MISKNLYIQIIFRTILMAITAVAIAYSIVKPYSYAIVFGCTILFVLELLFLIRFLNTTNRKIAYFLKAFKNEDFTLRFPENSNVRSLRELNTSLNDLNRVLQNIYTKNQAREKYYQQILKHADIGVLTINDKGHILYANQQVKKLLNHFQLNHIQQLISIDNDLYKMFKNIQPFERKVFELSNEREKIVLSVKSTTMVLDEQNLLLVVIQDIHKELDEKETDSWIKLIRVLTHEIMNTITPITSISDTILKNYQNEELPKEAIDKRTTMTIKGLEVVKDQSENLMKFVQSYRSILNLPLPDKKLISAQILITKTILLTEQYKISNITLTSKTPSDDLLLFIDEKQITQVLVNLTKNALESIGNQENGTIHIEAGQLSETQKYITITDNGPGIPKALMNDIFIPFFTTKNFGTGVGLSLSKQILKLHGGNLKVSSTPHKKTVFALHFT